MDRELYDSVWAIRPWRDDSLDPDWDIHELTIRTILDKGANPQAMIKGKSAIHICAERNLAYLLRLFEEYDSETSFEGCDKNGDTPLHVAAASGSLAACKFLLEQAKVFDSPLNTSFQTPLDLAFENDKIEIAQFLQRRSRTASILQNLSLSNYAAFDAARTGDVNTLKQFIQKGADPMWPNPNFTGQNCAHIAAQNNHVGVLKYLVDELQISLEHKDQRGETPLHRAAAAGSVEACSFLLDRKASQECYNCVFQTPQDLADENDHPGIVELIVNAASRVSRSSSLASSVGSFDERVMKSEQLYIYVKHLISGSEKSQREQLESLVRAGADPLWANPKKNGTTCFHLLSGAGNLEVLQQVVELCHGFNVDVADDDGETLLHNAAAGGHLPVVRYLVEIHHANQSRINKFFQSSADLAAENDFLEIEEFLTSTSAAKR